jgi:hypothetical protein
MTRRGKQTPETARHFATDLPRNLVQRRSRPSPRLAEQPNEKDLVDRLKRFEMFMHLPAPILRRLAGAASIRVYHAGEYLWRQLSIRPPCPYRVFHAIHRHRPATRRVPAWSTATGRDTPGSGVTPTSFPPFPW